MQKDRERFKAVLCTAGTSSAVKWSQVKHVSFDHTKKWKDGLLHVAESHSGKFVMVVEYRNSPNQIFELNLKKMTHQPTNRTRAMFQLNDGSCINIDEAPPASIEKMIDTVKAITNKGKLPGRTSHLLKGTPVNKPSLPWTKPVVSPSSLKNKTSQGQVLTPGKVKSEFTGVRTPKSLQKAYSPWKSGKRKRPDDEAMLDDDIEDGENLGASMLFTDQMDKENQYTPNKGERQSVLHKRLNSGGSIFLDSFEEKQKGMSQNKRKGPNPAIALSHNFYSRGKQMSSSYGESDFFSRTPSATNIKREETSKKSTPGFLVSRPNTVPRQKFSFKTWNKPSGLESSQRSLQGFSNLGNTCYMNAILQSLLGLKCFSQDLHDINLIRTVPKSSLYRALAGLLFAKQQNKGSSNIEHCLENVKAAISATATRFSGFMQHDAHEFLCQCLDQLKEDVERVNNSRADKEALTNGPQQVASPPSQVVPSAQSEDRPKFACAVSQNFELEVEHSILCQECGEEVSKKETFNDLSLDLPRANEAFSLQTALDSFCASEKLEYACAKCGCKESMVYHKFTKLPRVLILHLKRYTYDSELSADGKLRLSVIIPRYLTLAFHTNKNTIPPPARPNYTPAIHVPLSPLRSNLGTPSNQSSPRESGSGGGSIRKKLDYDGNRSGFKFSRGRLMVDAARKGIGHFISRYETEFTPDNKTEEKSKDDGLKEMDEDQQLALALELSRKDAEESQRRKPIKVPEEEFTDEELAKVLKENLEAEERRNKKEKDGEKDGEEDTDDELPVGLSEDVEQSDLQRALELSKRLHEEELQRFDSLSGGGEGTLQPLTNVGLLGGARSIGSTRTLNSSKEELQDDHSASGGSGECMLQPLTNVSLLGGARSIGSPRTCYTSKCNFPRNGLGSNEGKDPKQKDKVFQRLDEPDVGLLGGAKKYEPHSVVVAGEEPMDTEDDQPIAFSLDTTDEEDPAHPTMWDAEVDSNKKVKESSHLSERENCSCKEDEENLNGDDRSERVRSVFSDDHGKLQIQFSSTPAHSNIQSNRQRISSSSNPRLSQTPSMEAIRSFSKISGKESLEDDTSGLWKPYNRDENGDGVDQAGLWKRNENFNKNIFQQFSSSDVSPLKDNEERKHGDGEDTGIKQPEMSYDEMKAKEEEDIRKATELSMLEAKEMSEREAAEILRAQEMSLQDLHQSSYHVRPKSPDDQDGSKPVSPVYTKEEVEMLSKHSEAGHLSNAYRLVSIVSHIGSSSMTGHYVSDVFDVDKNCWLSYDDSAVMKRDERRLREERKRTGYIFFYHAKELL